MVRIRLTSLLACALLACGQVLAANPEPAIEVPASELVQWWTPSTSRVIADASKKPAESTTQAVRATDVEVRFEIGQDGHVRDTRIVHSSPAEADADWAREVVGQLEFEPSASNSARKSVASTMSVRLHPDHTPRIDGRTEQAAAASFKKMLQSLPEGQRMLLHVAVLQLNVEGMGSASDVTGELSVARVRDRIDGMTAVQIMAAAETSSRSPGAPKLMIEPAPVPDHHE